MAKKRRPPASRVSSSLTRVRFAASVRPRRRGLRPPERALLAVRFTGRAGGAGGGYVFWGGWRPLSAAFRTASRMEEYRPRQYAKTGGIHEFDLRSLAQSNDKSAIPNRDPHHPSGGKRKRTAEEARARGGGLRRGGRRAALVPPPPRAHCKPPPRRCRARRTLQNQPPARASRTPPPRVFASRLTLRAPAGGGGGGDGGGGGRRGGRARG